ncbi:MAG: hypothetical protein WBC93_08595 [Sulfitobacter sp.]
MTDDPQKTDKLVDDLFTQARAAPVDPPAGLLARVVADAHALQPGQVATAKSRGLSWAAIVRALGGWQGLGGLATAACAGFWIGVSPPEVLPDAGAIIWGSETVESADYTPLLSGFGWDIEEG